jgi:hypothetical protein
MCLAQIAPLAGYRVGAGVDDGLESCQTAIRECAREDVDGAAV